MKVLYISSAASKKEFAKMQSFYKNTDNLYGMPEASFKFHNLVIEGLAMNGANVYSLIGRPVCYSNYSKIFWKSIKEIDAGIVYHHVSILNLPVIKQIYVSIVMMFNIFWWLIKNYSEKEKVIIYDGAYVTLLPILMICTFFFPCDKIPIICDVYSYMANVEDARCKKNKLSIVLSRIISSCLANMQGYIFLTEKMSDLLNKKKKPYIVMEGISDFKLNSTSKSQKKENKFVVLYAGALKKEYGLQNLIDGFISYNNNSAELWICGAGPYSNEIKEYQKKDRRIKFFGHLPLNEVLSKEQSATLLINPRPTDLQFTQYSFPSKNMEYMVSGTPILTTKLQGMPSEYYEYIYTINGNDSDSIKCAFEDLSKLSIDELNKKGEEAQKFILTKKNKKIQARKILKLSKNLIETNNEKNSNDIKKNKKYNCYFIFLFLMYILLSRNTLYASLIFSTRLSAILLFILSIPVYYFYFELFKEKKVSKNDFQFFCVLFVSTIVSLLVKQNLFFFNFNFLLTILSCFIYIQVFNDSVNFKKIYIIVLSAICFCSLFNQYILKSILIITGIFSKLANTSLVTFNIDGTPFLNLITSFVLYSSNYIRNFGIFNEPSFFQFYLIVALFFTEQVKCSEKKKFLLISLFVITLLSTLSTTAYLLLAFYVIINLKYILSFLQNNVLCSVKFKRVFIFILASIIFLFVLILFQNEEIFSSFKFIFTKLLTPNASSSTRLNSILFSIQCVVKHPFIGVSTDYYLNKTIITNTIGSIWAMYGFIPVVCTITYIIKFSFNNAYKLSKKICLFIIMMLSINSHLFMSDYSFWIIIFSGLMINYEN